MAPTPTFAQVRRLLDAASGPMHPTARDTLVAALQAAPGDPGARHSEGRRARHLLEQARSVIASGLGVSPMDLAFLPGGPAAARQALAGATAPSPTPSGPTATAPTATTPTATAPTPGTTGLPPRKHLSGDGQPDPRPRVVLSAVEHSALLTTASRRALSADDPGLAAVVPVDRLGHVDQTAFEQALAHPATALACLQSANGEVGTRQDLATARAAAHRRGVPLLVDAQAGLGRDPAPADWDVLVGDARSWGGPGGIGILVVRPGTRWHVPGLTADVEGGRAPDWPWVPLALAAAEAWQQTEAEREADAAEARALVDRIRAAAAAVADTQVVGDPVDRLPHVVTFSCLYADGEAVVEELDRAGFAVASGSACTSALLEPSHVLAAMGVLTHGNVRISLPLRSVSPNRADDVDAFCAELPAVIARVRARLGVEGL